MTPDESHTLYMAIMYIVHNDVMQLDHFASRSLAFELQLNKNFFKKNEKCSQCKRLDQREQLQKYVTRGIRTRLGTRQSDTRQR